MDDRKLPTAYEIFTKTSLYEEYEVRDKDVNDLAEIIYFQGKIDIYCVSCRGYSTYIGMQTIPSQYSKKGLAAKMVIAKGASVGGSIRELIIDSNVFNVRLQCARNEHHVIHYIFLISTKLKKINDKPSIYHTIQKIGQYPSLADLNIPHIDKYIPILSKQDKQEFVKAIGLAAHGVGVGAYVYLRRIFENLIESARNDAIEQKSWSEELQSKYIESRVKDKIQLLKNSLPDFIVEHPEMYSLLSKGVHELAEDECLKHFDALRVSIEIILDQKLEILNKKRELSAAEKAMAKAYSEVSSDK